MSKDIRSYFSQKGAKTSNKTTEHKESAKKPHKRIYVIDSDSDDETTAPKSSKDSQTKITEPKSKVSKLTDLKPANIADVFGTSKVKRTSEKNLVKKNGPLEGISKKGVAFEELHCDSDFEATLRQAEESAFLNKEERKVSSNDKKVKHDNVEVPSKQSEEQKRKESPSSDYKTEKQNLKKHKSDSVTSKKEDSPHTPKLSSSKKQKVELKAKTEDAKRKLEYESPKRGNDKSLEPVGKTGKEFKSENKAEKNAPKNKSENKAEKNTPKNTSLLDKSSQNVDPVEKKREHAQNYMKFLQREGPKNLGSKELPKGKPNCLSGLTFVITGVLDSLEREQAAELIKNLGGRVTSSISKKTSYLVRGDEPGASKLDKAIGLGTPMLDEDGLLKLITEKSGAMPDNQTVVEKKKMSPVKKKQPSYSPASEVKVKSPVKKKQPSYSPVPEVKYPESQRVGVEGSNGEVPLWVEKYRPTNSKQVIGQQGDRSALRKLTKWLHNWYSNHSGTKKLAKPSPWAKDDDGAYFKAALLSGPPGVGKTTMAHVVSKELGFDVVEFNASDTRSKTRLHGEVSTLLSSQSLFGYFHKGGSRKTSSKHVLLMDEVDGMAGNEDRGGIQELIQFIKNSHVPIICMCNDRNHPKIRSLVNYCFDLRVPKPRVEQIRGAMMSIAFKEGLKISADAMTDMIVGANQDMRQILNHMTLWTSRNKHLSAEEAKYESQKAKKDTKIGPWDVLKKVFSAEDHKRMTINDKSDLFFYDYSLSPLFVQENYLSVVPLCAKGNIIKTLDCVARTADSISMGDVVDRSIRSNNAWSLLPTQAMFSSVLPGEFMEGFLRSQINFPSWLGKNSRRNKLDRQLQELQGHMRLTTSASKQAINLDYLTSIRDSIYNPLIEEGASGIPASLKVMEDYHLIREDLESIVELTTWPGQKDPTSRIESKVKAAMTRAYNKQGIRIPYSVVSNIKKKAATSLDLDDAEEDGAEDEDEEDEDITRDAMIKAKKRGARQEEAGTSDGSKNKGKGKTKGKKKPS